MKTIDNSRDILESAINTYGEENQKRKAVEEIGEYLQAMSKYEIKKAEYSEEQCKFERKHMQEERRG